jgi:hypothetical protein
LGSGREDHPVLLTQLQRRRRKQANGIMADLPTDLWERILGFVGNAKDFRNCERTCRVLGKVLSDDKVWSLCGEPINCAAYLHTHSLWGKRTLSINAWSTATLSSCPTSFFSDTFHRDQAFSYYACESVLRSQMSSSKQIILSVLGVDQWKLLVDDTLKLGLRLPFFHMQNRRFCNKYSLRGDSSSVLMTLLERCLVTQLERALHLAIHRRADGNSFPSVSRQDFCLQDALHSQFGQFERTLFPEAGYFARTRLSAQLALATDPDAMWCRTSIQDVIVRRLAYLAGITKMENDLYRAVWVTLLHVVWLLLKPACIELEILDRPPPPEGTCETCDRPIIGNIIFPKQIETSAKRLLVDSKVYGEEWHVDGDASGVEGATSAKRQKIGNDATNTDSLTASDTTYEETSTADSDSDATEQELYDPTSP